MTYLEARLAKGRAGLGHFMAQIAMFVPPIPACSDRSAHANENRNQAEVAEGGRRRTPARLPPARTARTGGLRRGLEMRGAWRPLEGDQVRPRQREPPREAGRFRQCRVPGDSVHQERAA